MKKQQNGPLIIFAAILFFGGLGLAVIGGIVGVIVSLPDMFDMSINTRSLGYISYKCAESSVYKYSLISVFAGTIMHFIGRFINENYI